MVKEERCTDVLSPGAALRRGSAMHVCDVLAVGIDWSLCEGRGLRINTPRAGPKARQALLQFILLNPVQSGAPDPASSSWLCP